LLLKRKLLHMTDTVRVVPAVFLFDEIQSQSFTYCTLCTEGCPITLPCVSPDSAAAFTEKDGVFSLFSL
jgi:hypothetical protein